MANTDTGRVTPSKQTTMDEAVKQQHAKTGATVFVACCMQGGMLLELSELVEKDEQTPFGVRRIKEAVRRSDRGRFKVRGPNLPYATHASFPIIGGRYAITPGIPKDFWEQWLHINKDADYVKNRVIFAADTSDAVTQQARDMVKEGIKTGFEALDVTTKKNGLLVDTRVPGRGPLTGGIETADESAKPRDIIPADDA